MTPQYFSISDVWFRISIALNISYSLTLKPWNKGTTILFVPPNFYYDFIRRKWIIFKITFFGVCFYAKSVILGDSSGDLMAFFTQKQNIAAEN